MAVPQNIQDLLNAVQTDSDDVAGKKSAKANTAQALQDAQTADQGAAGDLTAAQAHLATDLQALIAALQAQYGS
jgi:hypothetical protein